MQKRSGVRDKNRLKNLGLSIFILVHSLLPLISINRHQTAVGRESMLRNRRNVAFEQHLARKTNDRGNEMNRVYGAPGKSSMMKHLAVCKALVKFSLKVLSPTIFFISFSIPKKFKNRSFRWFQ